MAICRLMRGGADTESESSTNNGEMSTALGRLRASASVEFTPILCGPVPLLQCHSVGRRNRVRCILSKIKLSAKYVSCWE